MNSKFIFGIVVLSVLIMGQGCTTAHNQTSLEEDRAESRKQEIKSGTENTVREEEKQLY